MSSSVSRMDPGLAADEPGGGTAARTLVDLTAVVTGASRGIGRAVTLALAAAGARVLAVSRTGVGSADGGIIDLTLDLAAPGSVESIVHAAERGFGRTPDLLVNNAGAFLIAPVADTPPEQFDRLLALNLSVPFRLVHAFLTPMRARRRGHIVTLGSIADHIPFPGNGAYAASKFGLRGLHEVLRGELAGTGVRATLISPGAVGTTLWDELDPETRASFPAAEAMLTAHDVADVVLFAITRPARVSVDEIRLSVS
jgi:NADP-dependent 3-hydroxy acid dehydrogenase YdfG